MQKVDLEYLKMMAEDARGSIEKIYLHWSAGRYGQPFKSYHINIDKLGEIYIPSTNLMLTRNHTWKRNSRAVGIALLCCYDAQANSGHNTNFGTNPPTNEQIE